MSRLWAALVAVAVVGAARAAGPPAELAIPPDQLSKARELVRQLGSPTYQVREDATAELARMGRLARPALVDAVATSADYEVRARAARLLPRAEAAELQARLAAFVADADGKYAHDLPGWDLFRTQVGGDGPCRALFAEMFRGGENRELLAALAASKQDGGEAVAHRRLGLFLAQNPGVFGARIGGAPLPAPRPATLPEIATLLFAESAVPSADIPRVGQFTITGAMFAQLPVSVTAATNPAGVAHGEAYKRVLLRWLDTRVSPDDLVQLVNVAQSLAPVRDLSPVLRKAVTTDGVQGPARGMAMVYLVQRNKKAEFPFLKAQLKNQAVVTPVFLGPNPAGGAMQANCQVRDMALALLIAESGQSIHDYGFETAPGGIAAPLQNPYPTYAFSTDEARDRAQRKWADWEARHPAPAPAPAPKKD